MIGRRTAVGLSLLCALLFSAIAVQSASAAKAVNTTAYTCIAKEKGEFADSHCNEIAEPGTGKFAHELITKDQTTKIELDNATTGGATTNVVLKSKAAGAAVEVTCTHVTGTGSLHNVETEGKHTHTGEVTTTWTSCTVNKPLKCVVAEPIEMNTTFEGVEGLGAGKNEMGVEFKPAAGETFAELSFKDKGAEKCILNKLSIPLTGTMVATGTPSPTEKHTGATSVFTDAMTTETLKFGAEKAGIELTTTRKMHKDDAMPANPIVTTTGT